jgi:hypothetical protein
MVSLTPKELVAQYNRAVLVCAAETGADSRKMFELFTSKLPNKNLLVRMYSRGVLGDYDDSTKLVHAESLLNQ